MKWSFGNKKIESTRRQIIFNRGIILMVVSQFSKNLKKKIEVLNLKKIYSKSL